MIPYFPEFKNIEWSDRQELEKFTLEFPPYSDFNFTSLSAWNTNDKMMISQLNGNLIVLFYDYITLKPFLSFIGCNNINAAASELIEYSKAHLQSNSLKLIPEIVANSLSNLRFRVSEDENAFDYIIPVSYLRNIHTFPAISHKPTQGYRQFLKSYPTFKVKVNRIDQLNQAELLKVFEQWAFGLTKNCNELNEFKAFSRLLGNNETNNELLSIHLNNTPIAFVTFEKHSDEYSIGHFGKANKKYKGVYDVLWWELGKHLYEQGFRYLNIEQDLGIPGLRFAKKKYHPEFFLKKYTVEENIK